MIDQEYINYYYSSKWDRDPCSKPIKSGLLLLNKIKDTDSVIDVGCGRNPFKGKIKNLISIDPAFDQADFKVSILEFSPVEKFDVALCLGSINIGTVTQIEENIEKVISWLKPSARIFWRSNPGIADHEDPECLNLPFYPWSFEEHKRLSLKYGFNLAECSWEVGGKRIYAEWQRE
jgi:hypothetical protein